MPRLTFSQYHEKHLFLRNDWMNERGFRISRVSTTMQRDLFDFFVPHKELSEAELKSYREKITGERPSLPQSAGRAMAAMQRELDAMTREWEEDQEHRRRAVLAATETSRSTNRRTKRRARNITVSPVLRPDPDYERIYRVLCELATEELVAERAAAEGSGNVQASVSQK